MRKLGHEHIVVAEGTALINFNRMIVLNSTAAFLWEGIEGGKEFTAESLADSLVAEYEIDRETALKDSGALIGKWLEAGIISE